MSSLSDRAKQVLKLLIDLYVEQGTPIGSKALAQLPAIQCSSATIRHVMAELEEVSLITSPHTSAGRIPTAKGYRFFVDSLLTIQPMDKTMLTRFQELQVHNNVGMMKSVSNMLSSITQMASIVTLPKRNQVVFQQIEFLALSDQRILVVLVLNAGEVQNRLIHAKHQLSKAELERAGNYLTQHYQGMPLNQMRACLHHDMRQAKSALDMAMSNILEATHSTLDQVKGEFDYTVEGHANLLSIADKDVLSLQRLFQTFSEKRSILGLLDQCLDADGVQIYIGDESGFAVEHCSIITAPYRQGEDAIGMVGVIGPTRMDYNQAISVVDMTAKLMSLANQCDPLPS